MKQRCAKSDLLSVSGLASLLGISPSYVRKLEAKGLTPLRNEYGYRAYWPSDIDVGRKLVKRLNRRQRHRTIPFLLYKAVDPHWGEQYR